MISNPGSGKKHDDKDAIPARRELPPRESNENKDFVEFKPDSISAGADGPAAATIRNGLFDLVNPAAIRLFGSDVNRSLCGRRLADYLIGFAVDDEEGASPRSVHVDRPADNLPGRPCRIDGRWRGLDGREFNATSLVFPFADDRGTGSFLTFQDNTISRRRALIAEIARLLLRADEMQSAFESTIELICREWDFACGEAWTIFQNRKPELQSFVAIPAGSADELAHVSKTIPPIKGIGFFGRAWSEQRACWIDDIQLATETEFLGGPQATASGVRSGVAVPVLDESGNTLAIVAFFSRSRFDEKTAFEAFFAEIGELLLRTVLRLSTENELRRFRQRLETISEIGREWFWETDSDHRFTFFTRQFEKMFDRPTSDFIGRTRTEFLGIDKEDETWDVYSRMLEQREAFRDFRYSIADDAGQTRRISIDGEPQFDDSGDFAGYRGVGRDVTASLAMAESAQAAQGRLLDAIRYLPVGVALFDKDDCLIIANDFYQIAPETLSGGYQPGTPFETLLRHTVDQGLIDTSIGDREAFIEHRLAGHRNAPSVTDMNYADGRSRQIFDYPGRDGGTVVIAIDTTGLRDTQKRLVQSARTMSQLSRSLPGWVFGREETATGERSFSYAFGGLREKLGLAQIFEPKQIEKGMFSSLLDPESRKRLEDALSTSRKTLEPFTVDLPVKRRNGPEYRVQISASVERRSDGSFLWNGIALDISDQHRIRQELEQSRARFRTLAESTIQAIVVHRHFLILYANPAAAAVFGLGSDGEELKGRDLRDLLHPDECDRVEEFYAARMQGRSAPNDYDLRGVTKDKREVLLSNRSFMIDWDGEPAVCKTLFDITESRRAVRDAQRHLDTLARMQRMDTVNALASSIAHEIGQPLLNIKNYSAGALRRIDRQSADMAALRMAFEQIGKQSTQAGKIIQNVRSFLRPQRAAATEIDLVQLLDDISVLMEMETRNVGIGLTLRVSRDMPRLSGAPAKIEQLLLNLVRNSIEAIVGAGQTDGHIEIDARATVDSVRITVTDNGPGIEKTIADQVFDEFFTTKAEGIGLGLSICRALSEELGGTVSINEQSPIGASFTVSIPVIV